MVPGSLSLAKAKVEDSQKILSINFSVFRHIDDKMHATVEVDIDCFSFGARLSQLAVMVGKMLALYSSNVS